MNTESHSNFSVCTELLFGSGADVKLMHLVLLLLEDTKVL